MGPQASAELYRLINEKAMVQYGARNNDDYPEIVIDSVSVPDFISETKHMERAVLILEDRVRRLTKYGASVINIACNTACILIDRLQKQTEIPIVSIVDEVVKTVATNSTPVFLLASPTSLRYGLYQQVFMRCGISYVTPTQEEDETIELIIRSIIENKDRTLFTNQLIGIVKRHEESEKIKGVVLGCTELPLVFSGKYRIPVYNSLSILAESILKQYYYERRNI